MRADLRIGTGSFATQVWLGSAMGEVCARHTKLKLRSMEYLWHQLPGALMVLEIDVAIGEASDLTGNPEIVVGRLPRRAGAFICRIGHPLATKAKVMIDDFARFPLIAPPLPRRIALRLPAESTMGALSADGRHYQPSILCPTWVGIGDAVQASDAVGTAPRASLPTFLKRHPIVTLPIEAPWR